MKRGLLFLLSVLVLPLVSAYGYSGYGGNVIDSIINSEVMRFGAVFLLFFALVFYATLKTFKEQRGIGIIVAVVVSFFITSAFVQNGFLYGYVDSGITTWALIVGLLIAVVLFLKVIYENLGKGSTLGFVFVLYALLWFVDLPSMIGYGPVADLVLMVYDLIINPAFAMLLIVVLLVAWRWDAKKKKQSRRQGHGERREYDER